MPLPTNPEQEQVATRLAQHRGVTVQGPPGTGKTHTIANLISHLVGHGKRVLVTSQKEQALERAPGQDPGVRPRPVGRGARLIDRLARASSSSPSGRSMRTPSRWTAPPPGSGSRALDEQLTAVQRESARCGPGSRRRSPGSGTASRSGRSSTRHRRSESGLLTTRQSSATSPTTIEPAFPCPLSAAEIADLFRLVREITPEDRVAARLRLPRRGGPAHPRRAGHGDGRAAATCATSWPGPKRAIQDRVALERLTPDELGMLINWVEQAAKRLRSSGAAVAGRRPRRTAHVVVRRALARPDLKAIGEGIEELAAWRNRLLGHGSPCPATTSSWGNRAARQGADHPAHRDP